ncbi:MAG: glyoxalase/bleomycin resistance/dioxygenase family protein [Rhodospirillaceae bacterium]|nr:glyoxalase/bleomycin resistance/dioxygenase family protein [Rhodospirillaceae bacterium]
MSRMHVHVGVKDIESSVDFYTGLFGVEPTVCETDYAKWMLENPRVNFAISTRCEVGVNHLGIQCENEKILAETSERLSQSGRPLIKQETASCCYATGQKVWVSDPQGVAWETFMTTGDITSYGEDSVDMSQLKVMST